MTDGRRLFLQGRSAVAVIDSPSSRPHLSNVDRRSAVYLDGMEKVVHDIAAQLPHAKIYLVGSSAGSVSALHLASRMKSAIAGVVILAGVYHNAVELQALALGQPILFVHHIKDRCSPLSFTADFVARYHPVIVEDIGVHYAADCGPYSAHQFHGQEKAVVDQIYRWSDGSAVPTTIR